MSKLKRLEIYFANVDCENEAAAIERGLRGTPGLFDLRVYPKAAKLTLNYDPSRVSPDKVRDKLRAMGFPPQQGRAVLSPPQPWRNPKVLEPQAVGMNIRIHCHARFGGVQIYTPKACAYGVGL